MADKIFEDYQIEATDGNLQFRRYPLKMVCDAICCRHVILIIDLLFR